MWDAVVCQFNPRSKKLTKGAEVSRSSRCTALNRHKLTMKFEELKVGQICKYNKGNRQVYTVVAIYKNDNTAVLAYKYDKGRYCAIHFDSDDIQFFDPIKSAKVI